MYLNETFTNLTLDGIQQWLKHFESWPKEVPICVHAEGRTTAAVILLASLNNRSVHVCHVATKDEIDIIKAAKQKVRDRSWMQLSPFMLTLESLGSKSDVRGLPSSFIPKHQRFGLLKEQRRGQAAPGHCRRSASLVGEP